ncbi:MAG: peptidylprolyl isomerase [Gammaproteobacteria bacterium]|nr:peptidylprolyl isomerase [Gammaproteobacteria bacterium]
MISKRSFGIAGTIVATMAIAALSMSLRAETVATVNGKSIDSTVFEAYIASRLQNPNMQLTDEQRAGLLDQLKDVYILSSQEMIADIQKDPDIQAKLELQRIGVLAQAYIDQYVSNMTITDEEIAATYDEQIKLAPQQQYKARHILVPTQGEAVTIIESLIDGGNFSELAKEHSSDTSATNGGDLGWFLPNQMVAPFAQAVVRLQDGRYTTDPVQTEYGWHVILREGSRDAEPPPLESVREQIFARLQTQKLQEHLAELRASAN